MLPEILIFLQVVGEATADSAESVFRHPLFIATFPIVLTGVVYYLRRFAMALSELRDSVSRFESEITPYFQVPDAGRPDTRLPTRVERIERTIEALDGRQEKLNARISEHMDYEEGRLGVYESNLESTRQQVAEVIALLGSLVNEQKVFGR